MHTKIVVMAKKKQKIKKLKVYRLTPVNQPSPGEIANAIIFAPNKGSAQAMMKVHVGQDEQPGGFKCKRIKLNTNKRIESWIERMPKPF